MTPYQKKIWIFIRAYNGDALPPDGWLARQLNMARPTVQSAMVAFQRQGLISLERRRQTCEVCHCTANVRVLTVVEG